MLLKAKAGLNNISRISSILFVVYFFSQLLVMESVDLQNSFYFFVWFSYSKLISQTKVLVLFFISVGGKKLGR